MVARKGQTLAVEDRVGPRHFVSTSNSAAERDAGGQHYGAAVDFALSIGADQNFGFDNSKFKFRIEVEALFCVDDPISIYKPPDLRSMRQYACAMFECVNVAQSVNMPQQMLRWQ